MKGRIYENKSGKGSKYILKFGSVYRRSNSLEKLEKMLTGLRFKSDEGTFDERDYLKDQPLGFENLSNKYIESKKVRCITNIKNHIGYASKYFGNKNIKDIQYAELEDFVNQLPDHLSEKSKHNIMTTLHAFWVWVSKREKRPGQRFEVPEFPVIKFELGWRGTVSKDDQSAILDELKSLTWDINPKIYIACKFLATYFSIRPNELINIQQEDFNFDNGTVRIKQPKAGDPKIIPLLDEDIELLKSFPQALPKVYFFRHEKRRGVHKTVEKFGQNYLNRQWKKACKNLGVEGVGLYGGTKHSTIQSLRKEHSPEELQKASMHQTNKAFARYYGPADMTIVRSIYQKGRGEVIKLKGETKVKPKKVSRAKGK